MSQKTRKNHLSRAVFWIGLAILLITGWWFPGFLFLLGATMIAGALERGKPWLGETWAFLFFGIGIFFGFPGIIHGINWKIVGIVILVVFAWSILFSKKPRPRDEDEYDLPDDDDDDESRYV